MYRIIIIILALLPIVSFSQTNQTDANGLRQGFWTKQQPNGRPLYEGNFKDDKPIGEWKRYHEGGRVKAIINYRTDSDSAFTQLFNELGKKVAEGNYIDERKEGTWKYFSDNQLISKEQHKNGMKHGVSITYYKSGEIMEQVDWKEGKQEGNYRVFFKSGEPYMEYKVSNNQRNGLCLIYFENGRVELEAYYKNSLRDSVWKYHNEDGDLLYTLRYDNGELLNPEVRDSISTMQLENLERNKDNVIDPEKYMEDPSEFMMKKNISR
ncbi:MAG: hypothetical protein JXR61_09145 [Prolixibacteraceae bacterium]|nr:hypothetical protein [Prolixibacteraceae bacterium]